MLQCACQERSMSRIFWKGLSENRLRDGRLLLNVEFEEEGIGQAFRWTPTWSHMLEWTRRAYAVEVANETGSPYEPALRGARDLYAAEESVMEAPRPAQQDEQYCYECGWHIDGHCCLSCYLNPQIHQ